MIEISGLTRKFGRHTAVDAVSFSVEKGETMGLLGPNGAGKTTLMRIITGYIPPTDGRVMVAGMDMYDHPREVKRKVGYLPEQPPLYLDMTVREYLGFTGQIRGLAGSELKEAIDRAAALCGVSHMLGRLTGNLSKGYRQRVGLAQALIHDPEILVLDEPTSGLDPRQIIEIRELIRNLGRNRTVVMSSHIMQEVRAVCNKVAIINYGKLLVLDSMDRLAEEKGGLRHVRIVVARPESLDADRLSAVNGVETVSETSPGIWDVVQKAGIDCREELAGAVAASGAGLLELQGRDRSLEDIYLRAITGGQEGSVQ